MALLKEAHSNGKLSLSKSMQRLSQPFSWSAFLSSLYATEWVPFIRETFNGKGNALDYLGKYTHRIAISNARIINVSDSCVTFFARDYRNNKNTQVSLPGIEFVRRFLMHVLPKGFVKIRNYGFLANRSKSECLIIIRTQSRNIDNSNQLKGLKTDALLMLLYKVDVNSCPKCKSKNFFPSILFNLMC
jgi:hypothetical protein